MSILREFTLYSGEEDDFDSLPSSPEVLHIDQELTDVHIYRPTSSEVNAVIAEASTEMNANLTLVEVEGHAEVTRGSTILSSPERKLHTYDNGFSSSNNMEQPYILDTVRESSETPNALPKPKRIAIDTKKCRREIIDENPRLLADAKSRVKGKSKCGSSCPLSFSTPYEMAVHLDECHPRDYRCFLCPHSGCAWSVVGFHKWASCNRHISAIHGTRDFECKICHRKFPRSDSFLRHARKSHGRQQ